MRARRVLLGLATAGVLTSCGTHEAGPTTSVARVLDGDTIELTSGERVRLLQVDAPELSEAECYSRRSRRALASLVSPGMEVRLESDPALDESDRYGRLLRYVHAGAANVNLELAEEGAVAVYFFEGQRGRYADELIAAAEEARSAGRGLWGACPSTPFEPDRQVDAR